MSLFTRVSYFQILPSAFKPHLPQRNLSDFQKRNALLRERRRSPKAAPGEEEQPKRRFPARSPLFAGETKAVPVQPSREGLLSCPAGPGAAWLEEGRTLPLPRGRAGGVELGAPPQREGTGGDRRGGGRAAVATRGIAGVAAG